MFVVIAQRGGGLSWVCAKLSDRARGPPDIHDVQGRYVVESSLCFVVQQVFGMHSYIWAVADALHLLGQHLAVPSTAAAFTSSWIRVAHIEPAHHCTVTCHYI